MLERSTELLTYYKSMKKFTLIELHVFTAEIIIVNSSTGAMNTYYTSRRDLRKINPDQAPCHVHHIGNIPCTLRTSLICRIERASLYFTTASGEYGYRLSTACWTADVRASRCGASDCCGARNARIGSWKCNVLPSNGRRRSRDHGE